MDPNELAVLGLGLPKNVIRLAVAEDAWSDAATQLIREIRHALGGRADAIEHVGSTAVPGLLTKPIIDIAVRLVEHASADLVIERLETAGWEFRSDQGDAGGLVFVFGVPPARYAHLHVVGNADEQWRYYIAFRDRLRADATARAEYEMVKRTLAQAYPYDSAAYTNGKDDVVRRLRQCR